MIEAVFVRLLILAGGFASLSVFAGSDESNLAIQGYSPVSYFEEGRPEKGSPQYTSTYDGKIYYFTSAKQRQTFEQDPEAYAPVFPNHCPYSLALGRAVAIDPTNFTIADGRLLLFHRSEEMNGLQGWRRAEDKEALLDRARRNRATLFRF